MRIMTKDSQGFIEIADGGYLFFIDKDSGQEAYVDWDMFSEDCKQACAEAEEIIESAYQEIMDKLRDAVSLSDAVVQFIELWVADRGVGGLFRPPPLLETRYGWIETSCPADSLSPNVVLSVSTSSPK